MVPTGLSVRNAFNQRWLFISANYNFFDEQIQTESIRNFTVRKRQVSAGNGADPPFVNLVTKGSR